MEAIVDLDAAFEEAASCVRGFIGVDTNSMLQLYALYKQATIGPCNVPKPGIFSYTARTKWDAWNSLGATSMSDAKVRYIDLVNSLDNRTTTTSGSVAEKREKPSSFGVSVSCMANTEEQLNDSDKTAFDWVKEGNVERVTAMIAVDASLIIKRDDSAMTLLHWAADRGDALMIQLLVNEGANINAQDDGGQTALHFAFACGHEACIELLVKLGADPDIRDNDGFLPKQLCEC